MRVVSSWLLPVLTAATLALAIPLCAQQEPDTFRWVDFHSRPQPQFQPQSQKDQDVIVWVTRSLDPAKWTAIREIGIEYDAALVVTTLRTSPQASPNADTFTVWHVSLTSHVAAPLLSGTNLRWLDWMHFLNDAPPEPAALYDNCIECSSQTFFTAFHYDFPSHMWAARWMRGGQGAPVWGPNAPDGVALTQVYAAIPDADGRGFVAAWRRLDYGRQKPPEDFIYRYDQDPFSHLDRIQQLSGKDAEAIKQQLCLAQDSGSGLARGQDSPLCLPFAKRRPERKPVTTPPANNRGQSVPPGARH